MSPSLVASSPPSGTHSLDPIRVASIDITDRQRTDLGDLTDLRESIKSVGLIQPIVLLRGDPPRLHCGNRRLQAIFGLDKNAVLEHGIAGTPGRYGYVWADESISDDVREEQELYENVLRKGMTWQEHVLAVRRIHRKKKGPEWGQRETGRLFNVSLGKVNYVLALGDELMRNPDGPVAKSDTLGDGMRMLITQKQDELRAEQVRRMQESTKPAAVAQAATLAVRPIEVKAKTPTEAPKTVIPLLTLFRHCDILSLDLGPMSVDHIITDPPYGIDMAMLNQNNPHGGMVDIDRVEATHQVDDNLKLLHAFIGRAYDWIKPGGFFAFFYDIMHHNFLFNRCEEVGFKVQRWPVRWEKTHQCMNQSAQYNFTKDFEPVMICRKGNATLAKPATSSRILASNDAKTTSHPFAKPALVWQTLAEHMTHPNQLILDPFAGSCSSLKMFITMRRQIIGCEIDEKHFNTGLIELKETYQRTYANVEFV